MSAFILSTPRIAFATLAMTLAAAPFTAVPATAQEMSMPAAQAAPADAPATDQSQAMQDQIAQLKEQVAKLQGALRQSKGKAPMNSANGMAAGSQSAMGMEGESGEMGGDGAHEGGPAYGRDAYGWDGTHG